jgi:hypothetical protein
MDYKELMTPYQIVVTEIESQKQDMINDEDYTIEKI